MFRIKRVVDFYLHSSIHVALSVFALIQITNLTYQIHSDSSLPFFAFLGTIVGYNFVKYDALARVQKTTMSTDLKLIAVLSFFALVGCGYFFFQLERSTQILSVIVLLLTLIYTLPFLPNKSNARNWAGVKIYIVSLCWVIVTLILPLLHAHIYVGGSFYIQCVQRFLLILILILIFEIIDMPTDCPKLKTVPQKIGVFYTKILGTILLIFFYLLEFYQSNYTGKNILINTILTVVLFTLIAFANENRSRYFTSAWVESVPLFWWFLLLCTRN